MYQVFNNFTFSILVFIECLCWLKEWSIIGWSNMVAGDQIQ